METKENIKQSFQGRLEYTQHNFGLDNWTIELVSNGDVLAPLAKTVADPRSHKATITVNNALLVEKKHEWDEIIVHELIHIVMALYDFYADNLGREGSQELFFIAREASVSQLTHIMLRIINKYYEKEIKSN